MFLGMTSEMFLDSAETDNKRRDPRKEGNEVWGTVNEAHLAEVGAVTALRDLRRDTEGTAAA